MNMNNTLNKNYESCEPETKSKNIKYITYFYEIKTKF